MPAPAKIMPAPATLDPEMKKTLISHQTWRICDFGDAACCPLSQVEWSVGRSSSKDDGMEASWLKRLPFTALQRSRFEKIVDFIQKEKLRPWSRCLLPWGIMEKFFHYGAYWSCARSAASGCMTLMSRCRVDSLFGHIFLYISWGYRWLHPYIWSRCLLPWGIMEKLFHYGVYWSCGRSTASGCMTLMSRCRVESLFLNVFLSVSWSHCWLCSCVWSRCLLPWGIMEKLFHYGMNGSYVRSRASDRVALIGRCWAESLFVHIIATLLQ